MKINPIIYQICKSRLNILPNKKNRQKFVKDLENFENLATLLMVHQGQGSTVL